MAKPHMIPLYNGFIVTSPVRYGLLLTRQLYPHRQQKSSVFLQKVMPPLRGHPFIPYRITSMAVNTTTPNAI